MFTFPRPRDTLIAETIAELGFSRRGKRVVAAVKRAIADPHQGS
jgi:hypothetical protein